MLAPRCRGRPPAAAGPTLGRRCDRAASRVGAARRCAVAHGAGHGGAIRSVSSCRAAQANFQRRGQNWPSVRGIAGGVRADDGVACLAGELQAEASGESRRRCRIHLQNTPGCDAVQVTAGQPIPRGRRWSGQAAGGAEPGRRGLGDSDGDESGTVVRRHVRAGGRHLPAGLLGRLPVLKRHLRAGAAAVVGRGDGRRARGPRRATGRSDRRQSLICCDR